MKQLSLFLVAACALLAVSCKKAADVPSREDALRGEGGWKQTAGRVKYRAPGTNIDSNVDYWKVVPECYKDNRFVFKSVNDGTLQSGANRCDVGEPSQRTFFWQLLNGDQTLEINYVGDAFFGVEPLRATIKEFSGSSIILEYTSSDTLLNQSQPTTFYYTNTYTK